MLNDFIFHYGIPFYNSVSDSINTLYNIAQFYYNNVKGLNSSTLYFYENNSNVYYISSLDTHNNLNAVNVWKYDMYHKLFYNYSCSQKDTKYLPILTATITLHDKHIVDLTDFLSSIKVESSNVNYPSLQHILGAYEYTYGIILDRNLPYRFEMLDTELNTKVLNLFENTDIFTNISKN